jgi:hypothetical protein
VKQKILLVSFGQSFGNLIHLSRRGQTSFERRFLEEFEESLPDFFKKAFSIFKVFFQFSRSTRTFRIPYLHISVPHVEKLAETTRKRTVVTRAQSVDHTKTSRGEEKTERKKPLKKRERRPGRGSLK